MKVQYHCPQCKSIKLGTPSRNYDRCTACGINIKKDDWTITERREPDHVEQSEPVVDVVDTSTAEGWEKVVAHKLAGGDIEYGSKIMDVWRIEDSHPSNWGDNYTYRIKPKTPQRVPQVLERWMDEDGETVHFISRIDSTNGAAWLITNGTVGCWSVESIAKDWKYIDTVDLSLLEAEKAGQDEPI